MFVLRRIDCLLEDTKDAVLAEVKFQKDEAGMAVLDPDGLRDGLRLARKIHKKNRVVVRSR